MGTLVFRRMLSRFTPVVWLGFALCTWCSATGHSTAAAETTGTAAAQIIQKLVSLGACSGASEEEFAEELRKPEVLKFVEEVFMEQERASLTMISRMQLEDSEYFPIACAVDKSLYESGDPAVYNPTIHTLSRASYVRILKETKNSARIGEMLLKVDLLSRLLLLDALTYIPKRESVIIASRHLSSPCAAVSDAARIAFAILIGIGSDIQALKGLAASWQLSEAETADFLEQVQHTLQVRRDGTPAESVEHPCP